MPKLVKPVVFALCLLPAAHLAWQTYAGELGPNPAETLQLGTGLWALRFLLITLAVTPLRRVTGWNRVIQFRRMLGLFAFFYATLHFFSYLAFDLVFAFDQMVADVVKRPFITFGMVAFLLMIPLAITSTKGWIRRLGRRWQMLHRIIYVSGIAAILHFVWKVKVVIGEPVYYAAILAILLGFRLVWRFRRRPSVGRQPAEA
jgi:sulfoxide reductase heme-binding subunit YedZ